MTEDPRPNTGPWTQLYNINTPYGNAAHPPRVLATGPITLADAVSSSGAKKTQCLTAPDQGACIVVPGDPDQCAVSYAPCDDPPTSRQKWRLTSIGEIQAADPNAKQQPMCLDAALGPAGQRVYTHSCVFPNPPSPIGQLWDCPRPPGAVKRP